MSLPVVVQIWVRLDTPGWQKSHAPPPVSRVSSAADFDDNVYYYIRWRLSGLLTCGRARQPGDNVCVFDDNARNRRSSRGLSPESIQRAPLRESAASVANPFGLSAAGIKGETIISICVPLAIKSL